jgi:hypothetical protein
MRRHFSMKRQILCSALVSLLVQAPAMSWAFQDSPFYMFFAGAYPITLGVTHQWMDGEYGVTGGFGYKEDHWPVGMQFEGMTYRAGFTDRAEEFAGSDGYMQMTAGTANVTWMPKKFEDERLKPRLISGIGVYNRVIRTTDEQLMFGTCWDPWWGYFPCGGTGTVITNSQSQTKFGVNVGGSLGFEMAGGAEFFLEMRYHHAFTNHKNTQFMPLNFGFKW